ncbi:hypothetical protein RA11412_1812 [Rothia aeria]|uniref:Uncharacterized protein n=1 Tax=Rothia aeria TaxID=172042 RepID=A0A2Z5R0U8_9MICC|nr:hypothetical protein RA11412_1812 [Rothia aeria]
MATGEIAQISFIIVSICALGVLFFTWRAVAALVLKLNTRKRNNPTPPEHKHSTLT